MEAKDLRLGNCILKDGKISKLDIDDLIIIYDVENNIYKPIPLTEEILLKCGFGKSEEHEMGRNANKHFGFYYDYHFKRFRLETSDDDGQNYVDVILDISYLHQLQNLYFALTNEELTINL